MVRAITHIESRKQQPNDTLPDQTLFEDFRVAVSFVLVFSPDRESSGVAKELRENYERRFGYVDALERALEDEFFPNLYVERLEKERIHSYLRSMRPVFVYGLVGVGKTIICRRLKFEQVSPNLFIYVDLKAHAERIERIKLDANFRTEFEEFLYYEIFGRCIPWDKVSGLFEDWNVFELMAHPGFGRFRAWVERVKGQKLTTPTEWQQVLLDNDIKCKYKGEEVAPSLNTLLQFLKTRGDVALCLDNVDRYQLEVQRHVLSLTIDVSNESHISVITAIRESNLKRLIPEGEMGDATFSESIERVRSVERARAVEVAAAPNEVVEKLLKVRLQFLRRHHEFGTLDSVFKQFKDEFGTTYDRFTAKFWRYFDLLVQEFVDEGIYQYSNHNLRHVQIIYFDLIAGLLLQPELGYTLQDLIKSRGKVQRTRLRTYLYKWLMHRDPRVKEARGGLLNLYDFKSPIAMADLRILEYLMSRRREPDARTCFGEIVQDLGCFGMNVQDLEARILALSRNMGRGDLGLVWLDMPYAATAVPYDAVVDIMPSGIFVVDRLSVSREFSFWNALHAELETNLVPYSCAIERTLEEEFKIEVVAKFIEQVLVPAMKREREQLNRTSSLPEGWRGTAWEYYKRCFSVNGSLYPRRLALQLAATLDYTEDRSLKRRFEDRCRGLIKMADELERSG